MTQNPTLLYIRAINPRHARAVLCLGHRQFPCLLGKNGRSFFKREGDGKSPCGQWKIEKIYYRADRLGHIKAGVQIQPSDGWCDDHSHRNYNQLVTLPFSGGHEKLMREDQAYDVIMTTNHNQCPRVQGRGSAIFFHIWKPGATGTEGCIALREPDLRKVLTALGKTTYLMI